ncbi:MAG: RNA polymerase sigma factor [bacterium]|nr:RNA polymerase sigma factor [bacterium]
MNASKKKAYFTKVYDAESDSVFRFCFFKTSDRNVALELTQDIFLRFWKNISDGKKIKNHRAFLFKVARNRIIDWYRSKKALSLDTMIEDKGDLVFADGLWESQLDIEDMAEGRYVIEKIKSLHPTLRQAVYLRFVEGFSPGDIAKILDISSNAASVRINRGLAELRFNLKI